MTGSENADELKAMLDGINAMIEALAIYTFRRNGGDKDDVMLCIFSDLLYLCRFVLLARINGKERG